MLTLDGDGRNNEIYCRSPDQSGLGAEHLDICAYPNTQT